MKCTVVSYSLSEDPETLEEWKTNLNNEIAGFIKQGSEIILYPELFLMGLSKYFKGDELHHVAYCIVDDILPDLSHIIRDKKIFLVLGSGPRLCDGVIHNSCPIFHDGKWHYQDKLFLTPWETDFQHGTEMKVFSFQGLKTAVAVCFDSEQPDLAMKLKEEEIHLLLVPSATTNENGNNRVNRCCSARSIELGAAVVTSPLVGDSFCDLVDHNEGRQGFFLPAQEDVKVSQEMFSSYSRQEKVIHHYNIDPDLLKALKVRTAETKPYHKPTHPALRIRSIS